MEQKIFKADIKLLDDTPGAFRAVFATLGVIDRHGDVTRPGAFTQGAQVLIEPWNHGWDLPVGKGVIQADDTEAWVDGQFLLNTTAGKDHYETLKALGGSVQWSYTFDIVRLAFGEQDGRAVRYLESLDVVSVGPVTRGAGVDTRTVAIKSGDNAAEKPEPVEAGAPGLNELIIELAGMLEDELGIEAD